MISRTRGAIAVLTAMVALVSTASAQPEPGKASLGGNIGVPIFLADQDTKDGQKPRLLGQFAFQYLMDEKWRLKFEFGYGWIGYADDAPSPYKLIDPDTGDSVSTKQDVLTKFQPIAATFVRSFKPQTSTWIPFAGAGVNIHRMEIVNKRKKIQDPATFDEWVNWSFGVQALAGTEYVLPSNKNVTFDLSARWNYLFSKNTESFPSGFMNNDSYINISFGVNVYFWPIGHKPVTVAPGPDSTGAVTPTPAPSEAPAPAPATPDTSSTPPSPGSNNAPQTILLRNHDATPHMFGAFGVTAPLPATDEDDDAGDACIAPPAPASPAPPVQKRTPEGRETP